MECEVENLTNMEQIVVKTEVQGNGEIILFYVDENGENQEGVLTTIENIESQSVQLEDSSYIIEEDLDETADDFNTLDSSDETVALQGWTEEETNRLLVFYIDNKQSFLTGSTKKKHLWTVACKTMLVGRTPQMCHMKLLNMKAKYSEVRGYLNKGVSVKWPYIDLCHQAFHDDVSVNTLLAEIDNQLQKKIPTENNANINTSSDGIVVVKQVNATRSQPDEKVEMMLQLYLKYKKNFQKDYWRRELWDTIALELEEEDGEYWQKRFLNFKQHYIRMLEKRKEVGSDAIHWPYMKTFDQIFEDDLEFHRKYGTPLLDAVKTQAPDVDENEWNDTETTVLAKYYFDCYDEFQDSTIPNNFLWTEIGRLLDKAPVNCNLKYEELRNAHLDMYIAGGYNIRTRKPLAILFDNIISKDVEIEISIKNSNELEIWKAPELDEVVQFVYENIEIFKDPMCYLVCWASIGKKLKRDVLSCKSQWDSLVTLYKTLLDEKKENSDIQISWRYIETFDRIFDYGMDTKLLSGYKKTKVQNTSSESDKIYAKKVNIKMTESNVDNETEDEKITDDKSYTRRTKKRTHSKTVKLLEFYLKNKEQFSQSHRKQSLWHNIGKQIGLTATQCKHKFRNLKQVYTDFVQKEMNEPNVPIIWPYYTLCKKVFGVRAIKSKLKNEQAESNTKDWSDKEIKRIIAYFSNHFDDIDNNIDDISKWSELAKEFGKSEACCKEKFVELRKCYRKLKTMRSRNADVKISWAYFSLFEHLYNSREGMELDGYEETYLEMDGEEIKSQQEEDEYQCIIVLPEGQDLSDIENSQIIVQEGPLNAAQTETKETIPALTKWTKRTKKKLLIFYINYIRSHKGKEIYSKDMWTEIAAKLKNKSSVSCRKMFVKLKTNYKQTDDANKKDTPYNNLLQKILRLKPKFAKVNQSKTLQETKTCKDVHLSTEKVEKALQYYLDHIEDFVSPKFEKKYVWTELSNHISEPVTKAYNKINYLKQEYNIETEEIAGEKTEFSYLLKEIIAKEVAIKLVIDVNTNPVEVGIEQSWCDEETEQLLEWYLSNLDKFKNPKFVRSYLWMEASSILKKSPLDCSKKMTEIRTQYKTMVREGAEELNSWRFYGLCQKIYGTGKKNNPDSN